MEGRLARPSESPGATSPTTWDTDWYILRKMSSKDGYVILEQHSSEPNDDEDIIMDIVNISNDVQRLSIISDAETEALRNEKNIFIPPNLNFTNFITSNKPYSFVIETKDYKLVFSALKRKSFIQWTRTLNRVISYKNPYQVADAFRIIIAMDNDEDKLSPIISFLIDNYCDSARVHLIPNHSFHEMYAVCVGNRDDTVADHILGTLKSNIPAASMGWESVASAAEQQIDHRLAAAIRLMKANLPNLSPESADFLITLIKANTQYVLTKSERQYLHGLVTRICLLNMTMNQWSRLKKLPLSVYDHRGHNYVHENCHPRNLLNVGKFHYRSDAIQPAKGDWIIFKIESKNKVIPQAVVLRNCNASTDLRSIEISLGLKQYHEQFDQYAVLNNIRNTADVQYFILKDTKMSIANVCKYDYKYIKLKILRNWGGSENLFQYFSVLGIEYLTGLRQLDTKPNSDSYVPTVMIKK